MPGTLTVSHDTFLWFSYKSVSTSGGDSTWLQNIALGFTGASRYTLSGTYYLRQHEQVTPMDHTSWGVNRGHNYVKAADCVVNAIEREGTAYMTHQMRVSLDLSNLAYVPVLVRVNVAHQGTTILFANPPTVGVNVISEYVQTLTPWTFTYSLEEHKSQFMGELVLLAKDEEHTNKLTLNLHFEGEVAAGIIVKSYDDYLMATVDVCRLSAELGSPHDLPELSSDSIDLLSDLSSLEDLGFSQLESTAD